MPVAEPLWAGEVEVSAVVDHRRNEPVIDFGDVDDRPLVCRVGREIDVVEQGHQGHQVATDGPLAKPTRVLQLLQVGAPCLHCTSNSWQKNVTAKCGIEK